MNTNEHETGVKNKEQEDLVASNEELANTVSNLADQIKGLQDESIIYPLAILCFIVSCSSSFSSFPRPSFLLSSFPLLSYSGLPSCVF